MQRHALTKRQFRQGGIALLVLAVAIWARALLWNVVLQLFLGMLVALAALPIMKRLEKRLSLSLAASLSMTTLTIGLIGLLVLIVPLIGEQIRQLAAFLPKLYEQANGWLTQVQQWTAQNGIALDIQSTAMEKGQSLLGEILPQAASRMSAAAEKIGKVMLAPLFAFYFLRDRRQIGAWLLLCIPQDWRSTAIKALREMRRESAGFLRGQLMVSGAVAILTAIGLLFCGVPAWLLLGFTMGVLELIPYVGPILGGALVVIFALPGGFSRAIWALVVVVVVQQLEGGMLSPSLMSGATRLHPVVVLLCLMAGGAVGGIMGILFSVPLLLCARAAARVVALHIRKERGEE